MNSADGGGLNAMPRSPSLSFELLETFVTLIEEGGDASKAAARLGINQPSMSKRMSQLQGPGPSVASPWLERDGKTWGMTEEGRRMFPSVHELVRRYRALGRFSAGTRGEAEFAFACGQEGAATYALEALRRLRREKPEVQARISTTRGRSRIEGVASGLLDLATVTHDEAEIRAIARRSLHVDHLRDDPLVLVASLKAGEDWADALRALPEGPVPAEALRTIPLVLPEPDSAVRGQIDRDLDAAGVTDGLKIAIEVGGWSAILAFVAEGLGVGVVPRSAGERFGPGLWSRPLRAEQFRPIRLHLICRRAIGREGRDLSPSGERFRELLIECTSGRDPHGP